MIMSETLSLLLFARLLKAIFHGNEAKANNCCEGRCILGSLSLCRISPDTAVVRVTMGSTSIGIGRSF